MLISALLLQMTGWVSTLAMVGPCFNSGSFKRKMGPDGKHNWQSVLREAAYESLSKYTGFTESLDDKLERDTILWDKIHAARFLRKNKSFNSEEVRTGVLVDMTEEIGEFEFRQSDKSVYNCPGPLCRPIDSTLLAVWQIHSYGPNNIWIRVKVPLDPPVEDIYEFTSRYGLKQINHRENIDDFKDKKEDKHKSSKEVSSEEYDEKPPSVESIEEEQPIRRQDHNVFPSQYGSDSPYQSYNYDGNTEPLVPPTEDSTFAPPSMWGEPQETRPYHENTYSKNIPNYDNRNTQKYNQNIQNYENQHQSNYNSQPPPNYNSQQPPNYNERYNPNYNNRYNQNDDNQHRQSAWISEFRPNLGEYTGFIPSMGPLGSPPTYKEPLGSPPTYKDIPIYKNHDQQKEYNSKFITKYRETLKNYFQQHATPSDFKPSTEVVQYSERDPLYHSEDEYKSQLPAATSATQPSFNYYTIVSGNNSSSSQLPTKILDGTEAPKVLAEEEEISNHTVLNHTLVSNDTENKEITLGQPLADEEETQLAKSTGVTKTVETVKVQLHAREKLANNKRIRPKTRTKTRSKYDVSTMYPQWGERIKTTEMPSTTKIEPEKPTTTQDPQTTNLPSTTMKSETELSESSTSLEIEGTTNSNESIMNDDDQSSETTYEPENTTKTPLFVTQSETEVMTTMTPNENKTLDTEKKGKNIKIDNIKSKSPEEIVTALTTMGLLNNSVQIDKIKSEYGSDLSLQSSNIHSNQVAKFPQLSDRQLKDPREPISVVINTISRSYSYKTSRGQTGNLKQSALPRVGI